MRENLSMNQKNEDAQLLKLRMENARLQKENAELKRQLKSEKQLGDYLGAKLDEQTKQLGRR